MHSQNTRDTGTESLPVGGGKKLLSIINKNSIVVGGLSLLLLAVTLFAGYTGRSVVSSDQWSFLGMILNFYHHGFNFRDIWTGHGPQRSPGYMLLFLLDAIYFRLNLKLEIYIGILSLLVTAVIIYTCYRESMRGFLSPRGIQLSFIVIATILFSLNQFAIYSYSLSALDEFLSMMLFVWLWRYMDKGMRQPVSYGFILKFSLAMLLLLLLFGEGRGLAVSLSILAVIILFGFLAHRWRDLTYRMLTVSTFITALLFQIFYWVVPPRLTQSGNPLKGLLVVFTHPWEAIKYADLTAGSSLVSLSWHSLSTHAEAAVYIAGVTVFLGSLAAVWLFFRHQMWQRTWLPLIFLFYTVFFIALLLVGRFGTGDHNSAGAPRYITDLQYGLVCMIWVLYYAYYSSRAAANGWLKSAAVVATCFILIMQAGAMLPPIVITPYLRKANLAFGQYLMSRQASEYYSNPPPVYFCPMPITCVQGVEILKEYHLNIFRSLANIPEMNHRGLDANSLDAAQYAREHPLKILDFSPNETRANVAFNVQKNGMSALWIAVNQELSGSVFMVVDGKRLRGYHKGNIVTADIPSAVYGKPGSIQIYILEIIGKKEFKSNQIYFVVH